METSEEIYIAVDFPDEYSHSKDTKAVKGVNEKVKANAITVIGKLIEIADHKRNIRIMEINTGIKQNMDGIVMIRD